MTFAEPYYLFLIALLAPILWLRGKRRASLGHSQLDIHLQMSRVSLLRAMVISCLGLSWISACIAMARPLLPQASERQVIQTRDFVIQVDISGSMSEAIEGRRGPSVTPTVAGSPEVLTRVAAARSAVTDFIRHREGDRVALLLFNHESFYSWPLSRDHSVVLRRVEGIGRYVSGGTNFDGPDGAVQGAIDHFREMAQAQTRVLVLVTDGESAMERQRSELLLEQLAELRIRVYVLGVGPGWVNNSRMTQDLRELVESAGGSVIPVASEEQMRDAFDRINQLERSSVEMERSITHREVYGVFAVLAAFLLLGYLTLSALTFEEA
jgi:Ca-activated chloride channel family protein